MTKLKDVNSRVTPIKTRKKPHSTYAVENIPILIDRSCKNEWFYSCYLALDLQERIVIDNHLSTLCRKVDNMGIKGALELLVKVGLFVANTPIDERVKLCRVDNATNIH